MADLPLALTMGDPHGIGIELAAKAWLARHSDAVPPFLLIGHRPTVADRLSALFSDLPILEIQSPDAAIAAFATHLPLLDPGHGTSAAEHTIASIDLAVALAQDGRVGGVVTNPITKKRLYDAGFTYPGHTEYLAALTGAEGRAVMMMVCADLKVVPATIHIPLSRVVESLNAADLERIIRTVDGDLQRRFAIAAPRIVVAGLNPHAGEEGSIGREDCDLIAPLVARLADEGLNVTGPHAADTLFHKARRDSYDAAVCMYHDQALIPIKTIDFDGGVNVTIGLPIIRTSPDHGTAEDIAGLGIANPASLLAALKLAGRMVAVAGPAG
jgi:4-hydroxythreonine-4-phosphate dehydrogenase